MGLHEEPPDIGPRFAAAARSDVIAEELDGELVLLDERTGRLHVLNATAALVWRCLDGAVDVTTLATEISEELGADHDTVYQDVRALVHRLASDGLLEGYEPAQGEGSTVEAGEHDPPDPQRPSSV